ncbi:MAG: hypothetical protein HYU70_00310 [Bacteroidetes bacterium]|nr:hypothetical protein [Bacteroidota bacterium]
MLKELSIKVLKNVFAILGFVTPLLTNLNWKYNAVFIVGGLLISAIIHLLFELHEIDHKKYLKVKGRVPGNGVYQGLNIIRIESNPKIPKDSLLTLITKGNGLTNSICILKIIESIKDEEIQALQLMPSEKILELSNYFSDSNKLDNLFVTVIIKETDLQTLKFNENEAI